MPKVKLKKRTSRPSANPLRFDPSRTLPLQREASRGLAAAFKRISHETRRLLIEEDALGLSTSPSSPALFSPARKGRWSRISPSEGVAAFGRWVRELVERELSAPSRTLLKSVVTRALTQGIGRGYDDTTARQRAVEESAGIIERKTAEAVVEIRKQRQRERDRFVDGILGRQSSIRNGGLTVNSAPLPAKVQLLIAQSVDQIEGVGQQTASALSRLVSQALVIGENPRETARKIEAALGVGRKRAEVIARTETARAQAEGQLASFEELGVEELGLEVEWITAGDAKVCKKCQAMAGKVYKLADAKGLLPLHPSCRCAWAPKIPDFQGAVT